jgi:hypothetical protein
MNQIFSAGNYLIAWKMMSSELKINSLPKEGLENAKNYANQNLSDDHYVYFKLLEDIGPLELISLDTLLCAANNKLASTDQDIRDSLVDGGYFDAIPYIARIKDIVRDYSYFNKDKNEILKNKIISLINSNSVENGSNTPDFILGQYMLDCLLAFDRAVNARESWYGRKW